MRLWFCLFAAILMTFSPAAKADSFQFVINSSVQESFTNGNNDNFMGIYSTPAGGWGTQASVTTSARYYGNSPFSNVSFATPTGTYITSATLILKVASSGSGSAESSLVGGLARPDSNSDSTSIPAILGSATGHVFVFGIDFPYEQRSHVEGNTIVFDDLSSFLTLDDNQLSTNGLEDLDLSILGTITAPVAVQGYNYASYMNGSGEVTLPYTIEVSGTYSTSPVPEPSTIALLGTGVAGLAGIARRKFAS